MLKKFREKIHENLVIYVLVFGIGLILLLYMLYEWDIWHECTRDHSIFFCWRILL
jgi:hypothetical protein